ncbi:hypothetical protein [Sphingosinicella rhizophila]|nr:hypothetical protein [Sphingosinicella sp. GR2756]
MEYDRGPHSTDAEKKRAKSAVADVRTIKLDVIKGNVTDGRTRLKQIPR